MQACASLVDARLLVGAEKRMLESVEPLSKSDALAVRMAIAEGRDVLGEAYMSVNSASSRRSRGETYTPADLVESMIRIAHEVRTPGRVVDVGCGSGRYAVASARVFPEASIIAVDSSPMATLMCKATVCALGLQERIQVILGDFTTVELPECSALTPTLWIGNPPYVRHHDIASDQKRWLASKAKELGVKSSGLSGLHAYFVLSIADRVKKNDFGVLVTSAEWLDVKYGRMVRSLLAERLGLFDLRIYDKGKRAFKNVDTTSVVFAFDVSRVREDDWNVVVSSAEDDGAVRYLGIDQVKACGKWSLLLTEKSRVKQPLGYVRLGDFARVHRGIVTGANKFWVSASHEDPIMKFTIPVVSHAREIMTGSATLETEGLARLVTLPESLNELSEEESESVQRFIEKGEELGVDKGYVARSRKCWWSIPVGEPATILMTYMARRPPVFVANPKGVRSLNVVHGIYPKITLSERAVLELVEYLNRCVSQTEGRTYCGGLTKFEPSEVEALWVPSPEMLEEGSWRS